MANRCMFVLLVVVLVTSGALCQTFQYSRGWTNGKRSGFPSSAEISVPEDEQRLSNGELRRLKMLVHGTNVDEQPLLIHCDFMDKLKKFVRTDNYGSQLRQEKGQNDDNY